MAKFLSRRGMRMQAGRDPGTVPWSPRWRGTLLNYAVVSQKRISQGLLKRQAEDGQLGRRGSLNKQSWAIRNMGLCCGWEIWKNIPPYPFPSPSRLSLPPNQCGGKITALQFIPWVCCSQWLETPVTGMTYIMWWKESTEIFTNSYEMLLLP